MPTTADVKRGGYFSIYKEDGTGNWVKLVTAREKEISRTLGTLSSTHDGNADSASVEPGMIENEVTINALYDRSNTGFGYTTFDDLVSNREKANFAVMANESGGLEFAFTALVTDLSLVSNAEELIVFDTTLTVDGDISRGTTT